MRRSCLLLLLTASACALRCVPSGRPALVPHRAARSPGAVALAPSGIDGLPLTSQAAVFVGTYVGLLAGPYLLVQGYDRLGEALPEAIGRVAVKATSLLGALFMAAGATHFIMPDTYTAIYPPTGTWGLWYLPGSAEFHVAWTGAAEALGGAGLLLPGLLDAAGVTLGGRMRPLRQLSASALFTLTLAVSPANIYMYTHGATMPGAGPDGPLDVEFHYVRFVAQVVVLSLLAANSREDPDARPER